jgi:hypothetical protein
VDEAQYGAVEARLASVREEYRVQLIELMHRYRRGGLKNRFCASGYGGLGKEVLEEAATGEARLVVD